MTSDYDQATFIAYRGVLQQALAGEGTVEDDGLTSLAHTVRAAGIAADSDIQALAAIASAPTMDAATREAMARFASAHALGEAIHFAGAVAREPVAASRLRAFRRYAEAAVISDDLPDLATDRALALDATTFSEVRLDPGRIAWMLEALQQWRRDFIFVYHARHAAAAGETAGATAACNIDAESLADALELQPCCPRCAYVLGARQAAGVDAASSDTRRIPQEGDVSEDVVKLKGPA